MNRAPPISWEAFRKILTRTVRSAEASDFSWIFIDIDETKIKISTRVKWRLATTRKAA
jgi:hypothetical protein